MIFVLEVPSAMEDDGPGEQALGDTMIRTRKRIRSKPLSAWRTTTLATLAMMSGIEEWKIDDEPRGEDMDEFAHVPTLISTRAS